MRFSTSLVALTLGCAASSIALGGQSVASSPAILNPSHIQVQDVQTKLGITSWFVENHDIPVVSVSIAFRHAGNKADPKGLSGLCSFLSELLMEGAGDKDSIAFKEFLHEKNIQLHVHNSTDTFFVSFRTIKENVGDAFQVLKLIFTSPRFESNDVERVRQQMKTSLEQNLHSEYGRLKNKVNQSLYGDHPYGRTTDKILKDIPQFSADALRAFMKERFCRDQLVVAASGDIIASHLSDFLDDFASVLPEKSASFDVSSVFLQNMGQVVVDNLDIPQSVIQYIQPGISRQDPDFFAAFVLLKILGDGEFESRLWNEVREKRGLTYGINTTLLWLNHTNLIAGQTSTKNQSVQEVMNLIRQEWQKIVDEGVTEQEVTFTKERMIGSYALGFTATNQIADILVNYQLDNLGIDYINKRNQEISKVTVDQVNKVAKKLLRPDQLTFVIVGKPVLSSATSGVEQKS